MALQTLADQQAYQGQAIAEKAEATPACESSSSNTVVNEAGPPVSTSSAKECGGECKIETQQRHVCAGTSTSAVIEECPAVGENAGDVTIKPPGSSDCAAVESPSSAGVSEVKGFITSGKGCQEHIAGVLQVSSSTALCETSAASSGERRVSSSTCDDTLYSCVERGSSFFWASSSAAGTSLSSGGHMALRSLSSAESGLVSGCFQSNLESSGTSKSSGNISTTGTSDTLSGSTSSISNNTADGCESILKHGNSGTSDESNLESSPCCSRATLGTTNSSGSIESGATTSGGSSSCCESTRISLDSMLLSFETSHSASESSGSSYEEPSVNEDSTRAIRSPQQLAEQLRDTEAGLSHEASSSEAFSKKVKGDRRCNTPDARSNSQETNAKTTLSPDLHGTTQHTPRIINNIDFSSVFNRRRRSSSCSTDSRECHGRSRLTRARLRLGRSDLWREEEQHMQENNLGDGERLASESPEKLQRREGEREKANETLSSRCFDAGAEVSGSSCVFTAGTESKGECLLTSATSDNVFTEEIESTNKKSRLGRERSKQQLCSGTDRDAKIVSGPQNCNSNYGTACSPATSTSALIAETTVSTDNLKGPVRRSSPRHGSTSGGSSSRLASVLCLRRGVQPQQAGRGSNVPGRSIPDMAAAQSLGRSDTENMGACEGDRKSVREERGRATGGGGQSECSGNGANKDSAICKREDRWTSPFPGVKYCRSRNAWIARWSESGQEKWKTFPVKDSSFEEARRRALEFRQEKDRQKFERLWQQLNAEGLATGSSGEARTTRLSPASGKLLGSDSSSVDGGAAQNHAMAGRATFERNNLPLQQDTKGACSYGQRQQEEGSIRGLPGTPRLTRLSAYRSSLLLHSTQRHQQQRKKQEAQQQHQSEEPIGPQGVSCNDSERDSSSKSTINTDRLAGGEGADAPCSGRVWLAPCGYPDTVAYVGNGKEEESLSSNSLRSNGCPRKNAVSSTGTEVLGSHSNTPFYTGSTTSLLSPESGWLSGEDPVRRELSGCTKVAASVLCCGEVDDVAVKSDTSTLTNNAPFQRQQQQQHHPGVNGLSWSFQTGTTEGHEGLAGGKVVEALLRVFNGENAEAMRKQGLSPEKIARLLGERGLLPADAVARLPVEEMPVCRKRRSRDEDNVYTGSDSSTTEAVGSPTAMKILSMYKAALLLIMDDLLSNGLPLLLASGGGTPLNTDYKQLDQALAEGKVQLGDRRALVEHAMRKMLENQRKCIAEASLLGAVSPFVKLFEMCILDQKLPSQADDSGKMQLVYLNALSALQELSFSAKNGNSTVW